MRAVYEIKKEFTIIPNSTLRFVGLLPEARAILCYALSLGPDWHTPQILFRNKLSMSDHKVRKGIKNLEKEKFCHKFEVFDYRHRKRFADYIFFPFPTNRRDAQITYEAIRSKASKSGRNLTADLVVESRHVEGLLVDEHDRVHQRPLKETSEIRNSTKSTGLKKKTHQDSSSSIPPQGGSQGNTDFNTSDVSHPSQTPNLDSLSTPTESSAAATHDLKRMPTEATNRFGIDPVLVDSEAKDAFPAKGKQRTYAKTTSTPQECIIASSNLRLIPPEMENLVSAYFVKHYFCHTFKILFGKGNSQCDSSKMFYPPCFSRILEHEPSSIPPEKILADDEIMVGLSKNSTHEMVENVWRGLTDMERQEFDRACESLMPSHLALRALLVAKDLLKFRQPAPEGYPGTVLRVKACLKLPAPKWPLANDVLQKVSLIWTQAWRLRYQVPYHFSTDDELLRLATCVMYEWGGDSQKFRMIAEAFIAIEDNFVLETKHSPNVLVKQWRTNAEIMSILQEGQE